MPPRTPMPPPGRDDTRTGAVAGALEDRGFSLLVSSSEGVSAVRLPDAAQVVLGRTREADVVVADPSVSRRHARLRLSGSMTIEDLGSTNGTRVQGVRLRPGQYAPVATGTVIELGGATLLLERARAALLVPQEDEGDEPITMRPAVDRPATSHEPTIVDPTMKRIYALLAIMAPTPLSVLILGETGVGKELFAEAVHKNSHRSDKPFLRLNCAALPESVLEGELFGYERGAFTGATTARPGLFESAHGGSVFLDEIGDVSGAVQANLLRVLENGEVLRIGSRQPKKVDVRFISATNQDLRYLVANGTFRSDLFFRLNGISVTLPPLRKRILDIAPLARLVVRLACAQGRRTPPTLRNDAVEMLERYGWPGNVRELKNILERAVVLSAGQGELTPTHLLEAAPELGQVGESFDAGEHTAEYFAPSSSSGRVRTTERFIELRPSETPDATSHTSLRLRDQMTTVERQRIVEVLAKTNGNQKRAAEILGVSRRTLINKLDQYEIGRPRKGTR